MFMSSKNWAREANIHKYNLLNNPEEPKNLRYLQKVKA